MARALASSAKELAPVERLGLLGDEWWMVRSGRQDVGTYLDVASAFANDMVSAVVASIAGRLTVIGEDIVSAGDQPAYERWIRTRFAPQLNALDLPGASSDNDETHVRRATLLELVGIAGNDPAVQQRSRVLTSQYLKGSGVLPGTLVPVVLRVAAFAGDQALYDQYLARLATLSTQPEQYYRFLSALGWFKDPALVSRTLDFAMSPAVRTQDTGTLLANLMVHPWSQEMAWEFVRANWQTIVKNLGEFQGIPAIVESLGAFCSTARAGEIQAFFEKNPIPSADRAVRQSIERIESCAALRERQAKPLSSWISKQ
jgi:aminopeptidase N